MKGLSAHLVLAVLCAGPLAGSASAQHVRVQAVGNVGMGPQKTLSNTRICIDPIPGTGWTSLDVMNLRKMLEPKMTQQVGGPTGNWQASWNVFANAEASEGRLQVTAIRPGWCSKTRQASVSEEDDLVRINLGSFGMECSAESEALECKAAERESPGGRLSKPRLHRPESLSLELVDGGWAYLVGDEVLVVGGEAIVPAPAGVLELKSGGSITVGRSGRASAFTSRTGEAVGRVERGEVVDAAGRRMSAGDLRQALEQPSRRQR